MGIFERYLSLWVGLSIIVGVVLGNFFPSVFQQVASWEYAYVNLLVAVLVLLIIYPLLI